MNVKELIETLEKFDDDQTVVSWNKFTNESGEIINVNSTCGDKELPIIVIDNPIKYE